MSNTNKSFGDLTLNDMWSSTKSAMSSMGSSLSTAGTAVIDYEFSFRSTCNAVGHTCNAMGHALITDVPVPKSVLHETPVLLQLLPSPEELSTMSNEEQIRLLTPRVHG